MFTYVSGTHTKEICMMETFHAQCGDNEVIMVKSATYGRMRIGKCIEEGFGMYFTECIR